MEKKTDNKKEITLTSSQQRAFDQFKDFIESDKKVFILKGYAGTGKTTLLNSFVEELKDISLKFRGSSNQRIIQNPAVNYADGLDVCQMRI